MNAALFSHLEMIKIYAHRGSSTIWPENTLFAFNQAHQAGATGFETDLRLSKDREIILSHDDNLARFGQPETTVSQLDSADVAKIEICSPDGKYTDTIITLRKLLELYPDKDYIFDCKISVRLLFESLRQLLQEIDFHDRVWFLTWSKVADDYIREFFPGFKIFPRMQRSTVWAIASLKKLGRLFEPENEILALPAYYMKLPVFSRKQIHDIRKRRKVFMGYLVNTERELKKCEQCGVDYFLTDRPDLIATRLDLQ